MRSFEKKKRWLLGQHGNILRIIGTDNKSRTSDFVWMAPLQSLNAHTRISIPNSDRPVRRRRNETQIGFRCRSLRFGGCGGDRRGKGDELEVKYWA